MSDLNKKQQEALGRMMVEGFHKGDAAIVEGCLQRGGNPDVSVQDGDSGPYRPVLHWATLFYNEDCMKAMLRHSANIEARDGSGETALFCAVRNARPEPVEFLMKNGASPVAQSSDGTVVLDVARNISTNYSNDQTRRRDRIIKALTGEYGAAPEKTADFNAAAATPGAAATGEDIQALKPIELHGAKKGPGLGFNL